MPLIITATDFSDAADVAVNYACQYAAGQRLDVLVLNSYISPLPTLSDIPLPIVPANDTQTVIQDSLSDVVRRLQEIYPDVGITGTTIYGSIIDGIKEYFNKPIPPDMIVFGSNHADNNGITGSNTVIEAFKNLPCPVLAVPNDAIYKPVKRICFAVDYKDSVNDLPLQQVMEIVSLLKAELHILNISGEKGKEDFEDKVIQLHSNFLTLQPEYHFIDNEHVDDAIKQFVIAKHMDWLIIVPHKHNFFHKLFQKSHSEAMIEMNHIPVMALCLESNNCA